MGEGTFRGNKKTNPFVGKQGEIHQEKEIKIEAIFPSHLQEKFWRQCIKNTHTKK